jgi:HSP20 family protein
MNRELRSWHPSVDLYETDDTIIVEADLPGVKQEEVEVEIIGGELILRGRRIGQHGSAAGRFYTMERLTGQFVRSLALPQPVDRETIKMEFSDGVLRVTILKLSSRVPKPPAGL